MNYDIFPVTALAILGALKGKTAEEMAQELLEEEEKAMTEEEIFREQQNDLLKFARDLRKEEERK